MAALEVRGTGRGADLPAMARAAVAEGFDLIVAAGGDGTQAAVAGAVAGTPAAMAVIPGGTFNYFARDLGSGETVEAALKIFDAPRIRRVHVGEMNGMIFLNNVSFGAYPEILRRRESIYRRWGRSRLAAYWSAVAALWTLRRP
ncbi:diacylglycerol kinase family protein, partial [Paracoccus sp. PXZ]